jgi:MoaA/NifB/PqqE/SkfB family radical SAM enzyme
MKAGLNYEDVTEVTLAVGDVTHVGGRLRFDAKIRNDSQVVLRRNGEQLFTLAWFIVDGSDEGPWKGDFPRLALSDDVEPGTTVTQWCEIPTSSEDVGRNLIVTLVAEGRFWFHLDPLRTFVKARIPQDGIRWWNERQARNIGFSNITQLNNVRFKPFFEHRGRGRPLFLHLETVNICNLKCLICPYVSMQREKETMSTELFEAIVSDYVDMGGGDVGLTPSVGDIFLDKRIADRVRYLRMRPEIKSIGFVTNAGNAGVLSDDDLRYVINECARINISVYGLDEEENAAMTRRKGKFEQIQEQIRRIVFLNSSAAIVFAFRLLKQDAEQRAHQWMRDSFGGVYPHEVLTRYGNWGGAIDITEPLPFQGDWLNPSNGNDEHHKPCAYPALHLKVAVNGDVKFCSCIDYDSTPENIIGNVKQQHLSDIYNGLLAKKLWSDGLSICRGCTHFKPIDVFETHYDLLASPIQDLGI